MEFAPACFLLIIQLTLCYGFPKLYSRLDRIPAGKYDLVEHKLSADVDMHPERFLLWNRIFDGRVMDLETERNIGHGMNDFNLEDALEKRNSDSYYKLPKFRIGRDVDHVDPAHAEDIDG
ncbi:Hypothetical predicted protein [Mytilus galloprovincialis]|uniref:Uncharacterized protein n=1 Tax=Mytilus galloprovincialis TaxID=29158 RepID=A0A8B6ESU6_MYTGA|nr:Hypothetical predicted protein [Mytilus galloprovincialis]